jgi:small subunit ribosomal protein S2
MSEAAQRCGQYYVNHRWLGGMLTNWKTISVSIKRLKHLEDVFANPEASKHTKMELLQLQREYVKLQRALGGIKNMGGLPDALFVVDTNKENIAIAEAKKLGIPVVAIVDSNCTPDDIDFIVPGNDDSTRALRLYGRLVSDAILDGISAQVAHASAKQGDGESSAPRRSGGRKTVVNLSAKASQAAKKTGSDDAEVAEVVAPEASEPVKAAATRG